ncbi:MAG: hypothetical protein WD226_13105 [Planctomycetota bacterium]
MPSLAPFVGALALVVAAGCAGGRAPADPWRHVTERYGVGVRLPIATHYELVGEFFGEDLATGEPVVAKDEGRLKGRVGGGLRIERFLDETWSLAGLVEARSFDVRGLSPFGDDLPLEVETIEAWQVALQLKHRFRPNALDARFRPWVGVEVAYLPDLSADVTLDLSSFGSSDLELESKGEPFFVGALQAGVSVHVAERVLLELGVAYEHALTKLDADLSFEIAGERVPITAEYVPRGWILGWGLTWLW